MADQVDVARGQAARTRANVVLAGGPYLGWIILGWVLTWAAVELHMLRRLRDTMSLTGEQWEVVIAFCSSLAGCRGVRGHPAVAQRKADARAGQEFKAGPAARPALNNARAAAT
jgi:hypothetical protein